MPDKVTIFVIFYLVFLAAALLLLCSSSAKRHGTVLPFTFDPRKRDGRSVTLKFAAVAVALIFTEPAHAANAQHLAKFLESFGVGGGVYPGREAQYIYLGVRNNRDGGVTTPTGVTNAINLHNSTLIPGVNPGVKASLLTISQPGWPTIPQFMGYAESLATAGALLAIEGVNEPHNFGVTYNGRYGGGGGDWLPVAQFTRDLRAAVVADPWISTYPVFSPSETGAESGNYGLQWTQIPKGGADPTKQTAAGVPDGTIYYDFANAHNYVCSIFPDPVRPNQAWLASDPSVNQPGFDGEYGNNGVTWGAKYAGYTPTQLLTLPKVTTETGWQTGSGKGFVSEDTQGKVLLNTLLDQFKRGWAYTFFYELYDGGTSLGTWGLFHSDKSPKLAATYFHNLTSALVDVSYGSLGQLPYSFTGPATVHDLLLQRSDGQFFLILWNERVPGDGGSDDIPLDLGQTFSSIDIYDPTVGTGIQRTYPSTRSLTLHLTDHPLILALKPAVGSGNSVSFVKRDTTTMGNWSGVYGADGYNISQDTHTLTPSYASVGFSGQSNYTWVSLPTDKRALQRPENPSTRIAACWYSATNFTIDVNLTDGKSHQVALYANDWDHDTRKETINVIDAATGAVLDTQILPAGAPLHNGEYLVWNLKGHVKFQIVRNVSYNSVISGIFFR